MKKVNGSERIRANSETTKKRQKAIELLFEGQLSNEEIAEKVHIGKTTFFKWKKDPKFQKAFMEYSIKQLNHALPDAIKELINLIKNSKSEMVKLQAIQTVFKHAGLLSDNSTPELDKARLRKAIAEAELTEIKAEQLKHVDENAEDKLSRIADVLWGDSSDKDK